MFDTTQFDEGLINLSQFKSEPVEKSPLIKKKKPAQKPKASSLTAKQKAEIAARKKKLKADQARVQKENKRIQALNKKNKEKAEKDKKARALIKSKNKGKKETKPAPIPLAMIEADKNVGKGEAVVAGKPAGKMLPAAKKVELTDMEKRVQREDKFKKYRDSIKVNKEKPPRAGLMNTEDPEYQRRIKLAEYRSSLIGKPMPQPPQDPQLRTIWEEEEAKRQKAGPEKIEADRQDIQGRNARVYDVPTEKQLREGSLENRIRENQMLYQDEGPGRASFGPKAETREEMGKRLEGERPSWFDHDAYNKLIDEETENAREWARQQSLAGSKSGFQDPDSQEGTPLEDTGGRTALYPQGDDKEGLGDNLAKMREEARITDSVGAGDIAAEPGQEKDAQKKYSEGFMHKLGSSGVVDSTFASAKRRADDAKRRELREAQNMLDPGTENTLAESPRADSGWQVEGSGNVDPSILRAQARAQDELDPVRDDGTGGPIKSKGVLQEFADTKSIGNTEFETEQQRVLEEQIKQGESGIPSNFGQSTFDAEKPVPKKIAELPREAKTAAKEANGTHVRDEATGFTLNLSRLKKSFKRQERFAMLKHVPKENRAAMLAEWGYIDPDELTVAQKKSALDIQKLKNAELQGAAFQIELDRAEKNVGQSLTPVQEKQFNMLRDQHKEASKEKPPNWALMKSIDEELGGIHSSFKSKNRDYEKMEKQYWGNQKKEAAKIPAIARLNKQFDMPDSKYYFDTIQTLERDFTKSVKGKSATQFLNIPIGGSNPAFAGQDSQPESATTVENYFKNEGLPTWRNVKERLSLDATNPEIAKANAALAKKMNIKSLDGMSEPQYMQWATSKVKSEILRRRLGSYHIGMQNLLHRNVVEKENILNNPKAVDEENSKPTEAPEIPDPTKVEPLEAISTEEYSEDIPLKKDLTRSEKTLIGKDFFEAPPETSNMQRSVDRNLFSDLRMGKITKEEFLEKVSSPGWYTQRYGLNKKLKRSFDELK